MYNKYSKYIFVIRFTRHNIYKCYKNLRNMQEEKKPRGKQVRIWIENQDFVKLEKMRIAQNKVHQAPRDFIKEIILSKLK